MNSKVIEFPTSDVRSWVSCEKTIRQALEKADASPEMIKDVCVRMKEYFKKFNVRFEVAFLQLPPLSEEHKKAIDKALADAGKKLGDQVHEFTAGLMVDRLKLEIELYGLRHKED